MDCTLRNARITQGRNTRIADLTLTRGRIHCVGERVEGVGKEIDLRGLTVMPAFIDSHLHLSGLAATFLAVDLREAGSLEEALAKTARFAARLQPGEWVTGGRWDRNRWSVPSFPDRRDLDRVLPDRPVQLWSRDGHALWLNSKALEVFGITWETPDPPGGVILRETEGAPSGILLEKAADRYASKFSALASPERMAEALRRAAAALNAVGVVACNHFAGVEEYGQQEDFFRSLQLPLRLNLWLDQPTLPRLIEQGLKSGQGDERVKFGGLKIYADGSLGSGTAWMLLPYEGSESRGVRAVDPESLTKDIGRAARAGIATAVHAIGDAAVRMSLDGFAPTASLNARLRSRIEHAQLVAPGDFPRFLTCGLLASVQPIHAPHDRWVAFQRWGNRAGWAYPYRALWEAGVRLIFGTDAPVEDPDPLPGLYAAVFRRLPGQSPEEAIGPREALPFDEALRAYTVNGAWGMFSEKERGTLAPGQLADLVVLDRDIQDDPLSSLPQARVLLTFLDGNPVYVAEEADLNI